MTQGTTQGETELHLKIESHNHWWYRWKYELRENDELVVWNYSHTEKGAIREAKRTYWWRRKSWFRRRNRTEVTKEIDL